MTMLTARRARNLLLISCCALAPAIAPAEGVRLIGESDGDDMGFSVAAAGDVNGDGMPDVIVGAPSQDTFEDFAGRAYLFHGPFTGDRNAAAADATISTQNFGDNVGFSVASAGDTNGDGFDDLLIGARGNDGRGIQAGRVYLFLGPVSGALFPSDADAVFSGDEFDELGRAVAGAGDLDDDGFADIALGGPLANDGGVSAGQVLVYYGPITGAHIPADADARITGLVFNEQLGHSVAAAGDLDGDGVGDLVIGAPRPNLNGSGTGTAYVFFGPVLGGLLANEADVTIAGERQNDEFGSAVSSAGDVNADGFDDLFVSAAQFSAGLSGKAYVFHGPLAGFVSAGDAAAILKGEAREDIYGDSSAAVGDVNGDGFGDFLVGGEFSDSFSAHSGRAFLYFGPLAGRVAPNRADAVFTGAGGDALGISVSAAGDLDADGLADLLLGATGGDGVGYTQVLFGADLAAPKTRVAIAAVDGPINIPPVGGSFDFRLTVRNLTDTEQTVQLWTSLLVPPANTPLSPLFGPITLTLPPNATVRRTLTQNVPGTVGNGNLTLNTSVRNPDNTVGDLASLRFTKGPTAD